MEANKAKSKFVYPDRLYARCKDNKTLDISYAPQTLEAVEYVRTDAFIEKAAEWLNDTLMNTDFYENEIELMEKDFKKAMKL